MPDEKSIALPTYPSIPMLPKASQKIMLKMFRARPSKLMHKMKRLKRKIKIV